RVCRLPRLALALQQRIAFGVRRLPPAGVAERLDRPDHLPLGVANVALHLLDRRVAAVGALQDVVADRAAVGAADAAARRAGGRVHGLIDVRGRLADRVAFA